jgi:dihydrofolate reductase
VKISVYVGTSLDGFIARADGNIDWLVRFENDEIGRSYTEFISRIDAMVIGRGTFEKVLSFPVWPYERPVFLLSTSINKVPDIVAGKVHIISMPPKDVLSYLSRQGYSNIYIDGGKVIQSFLREGLVDELIVTTVPSLIGSGIPLFGEIDKDIQFRHIKTHVFSNGLVKSQYEVVS